MRVKTIDRQAPFQWLTIKRWVQPEQSGQNSLTDQKTWNNENVNEMQLQTAWSTSLQQLVPFLPFSFSLLYSTSSSSPPSPFQPRQSVFSRAHICVITCRQQHKLPDSWPCWLVGWLCVFLSFFSAAVMLPIIAKNEMNEWMDEKDEKEV